MIKSEATIYTVLEALLRAAGDKPQTCVDLYDSSAALSGFIYALNSYTLL